MDIEKFCGRSHIVELLKRRVLDLKEGYRQNVALLGFPYVGKTAILHKFLFEADDPSIVTVYLDATNQDLNYFCHRIVASLLYGFCQKRGLPLQEEIPLLLETLRDSLPQTSRAVKKIQSLLAQHKRTDAYREIISFPQTFTQEANLFCVLVFDEFHELEEIDAEDVFKILGAKIMTQKRCLYVVASSSPATAEAILSEKMSLLFGNFEKIAVEPFDLKTSQAFLESQIPGVKMGDSLQYFLIDFTGGQPLSLQLITEQLSQMVIVHHQEEVFWPLLSQAIENVLFHHWGVLSRHYSILLRQLLTVKSHVPLLSILLALTEGRRHIKDLSVQCGLQTKTVQQRLARLIETGVVLKNGNGYYLKDKVFRFWLRYVFFRKQRSLDMDEQRARQLFQEDLRRSYDAFLSNAQKDFSGRIIGLLSRFEKEVLLINGRRYDLSTFHEINPEKEGSFAEAGVNMIRASARDGEWWVALKPGPVGEGDINLIVEAARRSPQRPRRCVVISLQDLDENARVRALQERFWIWNERELRALLDLFDQPGILPAVA